MNLNLLIRLYVMSPKDGFICFKLAYEYEKLKQYSSAILYYEMAIDYLDNDLKYECYLRIYNCVNVLGGRDNFRIKNLNRAISLYPNRSEAYFLLSLDYENSRRWEELYMVSRIGYELTKPGQLNVDIGFYGLNAFIFQMGISLWWLNRLDESRNKFSELLNLNIPENVKNLVYYNLDNFFGDYIFSYKKFSDTDLKFIRYKFDGLENVKTTYSECFQDLFVLMALNGKTSGTFLEIGCNEPIKNNNTYLLEKDFNWKGISIDNNPIVLEDWLKYRNTVPICENALDINYDEILENKIIDYLQIDCNPAQVSLEILYKIPFDKFEFCVITFEHDYYLDVSKSVCELSRQYLSSLGYIMVVGNISPNKHKPFEDWWINPKYIDDNIILSLISNSSGVNYVHNYMFKY